VDQIMHNGKYSDAAKSMALLALQDDIHPDSGLPWVTAFEELFAKFTKSDYAIAVNSGTSGLHAALMGLGVGPGDEVISPALTVIMDSFAIDYVGATKVYGDVCVDTWNLDPAKIEALITPATRAVISVSWFGLPSDLSALRSICNKHGLALIDDSAETISLNPLEESIESAPDIRVFSFESKKHMSTGGEGGMVTTNNQILAQKIRKVAGLGYKHLTAGKGRTSLASRVFQNPSYERFDSLGYNYRMTPVTAAIGIGQLSNISFSLMSRKKVAEKFLYAVRECEWLKPQATRQGSLEHSYYTFGVRYQGLEMKMFSWQNFYDRYIELGGDGFYANCKNPYLEPIYRGKSIAGKTFSMGLCPVAESLQDSIMAFKTNYMDMDQATIQANILSALIDEIGR